MIRSRRNGASVMAAKVAPWWRMSAVCVREPLVHDGVKPGCENNAGDDLGGSTIFRTMECDCPPKMPRVLPSGSAARYRVWSAYSDAEWDH